MKRNLEQFNLIATAPSATLCVELCGVSFTVVPGAGRTEWRSASPVMLKGAAQRPYLCGISMIHRNTDRLNSGH